MQQEQQEYIDFYVDNGEAWDFADLQKWNLVEEAQYSYEIFQEIFAGTSSPPRAHSRFVQTSEKFDFLFLDSKNDTLPLYLDITPYLAIYIPTLLTSLLRINASVQYIEITGKGVFQRPPNPKPASRQD